MRGAGEWPSVVGVVRQYVVRELPTIQLVNESKDVTLVPDDADQDFVRQNTRGEKHERPNVT